MVMQGDPDVLRLLNEQLTSELTAINQYFLHSKMQDNWGFTELAAHTRAESFDEMRHAEEITDRILLLDGFAELPAHRFVAYRPDAPRAI
ncbi:bacterioferritin [Mycobacterium tuberculosis RGTB423]|nr:bacterioferritin [Mycobacterium tuberculosis RGTB423]